MGSEKSSLRALSSGFEPRVEFIHFSERCRRIPNAQDRSPRAMLFQSMIDTVTAPPPGATTVRPLRRANGPARSYSLIATLKNRDP